MQYPILYSFRRCPYAMRARLALFSGVSPFILREILLKDKPQPFLTLSPKATVPVLHLPDGEILDESIDIINWVFGEWLEQRGELHPWDVCDDADGILNFIDEFEVNFKSDLDGYKYGDEKDFHFLQAAEFLLTMEERLATQNYLFSETPSLADIASLPFIRQFARVNQERFLNLPLPHLQQRLLQFQQSKLFLEIMQKFPLWEEANSKKEQPIQPQLAPQITP